MTIEDRIEYVNFRIDSAHRTFKAAKVLAENGFWNSTVNRLYYSVFYAVNALLVMNEIKTKTHSSSKSQFSLHFVKTGKFDKRFGKLLSELFDLKQKGDYDNIFEYDRDSVLPLFNLVEEMIEQIEKEIRNTMK